VYIAILSFFVFGMLANLMFLELIPILKGIPEPDISEGSFIYNLLISFLAFSSIAIISSYYFEKIKRTGTELQNIQAHLKDMVLLNTTVLEKMENGFVTSDSQGVIISYNEKSKSLMKLNSTTNIFRHLFSEHDYKCVENLGFDKPKYYFERKLHDLYLGITVSFIENIYSFKKVYVFIVTDLTEKKDIEEMLKKKDHFALIGEVSAGIAHEIRNPLASISGSVQFLSKELQLNDEYKNLMNIIVNESQRLSKSIEGFLDFTKSSPLEKTAIDLSAMINDVIELISLSHQKIQFIKRIEQNIVFFADIKKMKQVLWNLFTNAVKAVPNEGGIIEILTYRKNNDYYLSIRDNGIGIEKNDLEKLFTPFYSKFTSGIGLGMALVKRILDEHHFEIEIKSQINVGTEVILCLKNN
jgi:two-component system sensor histidine kinase PilS (NtrC family)